MTSPSNPLVASGAPPGAAKRTKLVVGLGNPGREYDWTPHNLGFHALERLAVDLARLFGSELPFQSPTAFPAVPSSAPCLVTWCAPHDAWLVKPLTFMNRSGAAVAPLVRSLGLEHARVIVVYDDLDLEPGRLRMRPHGGAGGHNGVRSILETLGSDAFPRLRIGVGRPRTDAARHVLTALDGDELTHAQIAVAQAAEALAAWIVDADTEGVMTRFHSRWKSMGE